MSWPGRAQRSEARTGAPALRFMKALTVIVGSLLIRQRRKLRPERRREGTAGIREEAREAGYPATGGGRPGGEYPKRPEDLRKPRCEGLACSDPRPRELDFSNVHSLGESFWTGTSSPVRTAHGFDRSAVTRTHRQAGSPRYGDGLEACFTNLGGGSIQRHAAANVGRHIQVLPVINGGLALLEAALGNDLQRQLPLVQTRPAFA